MKKTVSILLATALFPVLMMATELSVYIPYTLGHSEGGVATTDPHDWDYDYDNKDTFGLGIGVNKKLGAIELLTALEYKEIKNKKYKAEDMDVSFYTLPDVKATRLSGQQLDIVTTANVKRMDVNKLQLWFGARANVGLELLSSKAEERTGFELGIAPVVGMKVKMTEKISFDIDVDYKVGYKIGVYKGSDFYTGSLKSTDGAYSGFSTGPTLRAGITMKI